jgi:DNA-binding CsgD family transcriptional regulator
MTSCPAFRATARKCRPTKPVAPVSPIFIAVSHAWILQARLGILCPRFEAGGAWKTVSLSRRENEILALLADGLSNKLIAARLCIRPEVVNVHLHRHSRTKAILKYLKSRGPKPL